MLKFTFSDGLSARLARARAALTDFSPAMAAIASHLEETTRERFERSAGPDGAAWKPSRRAQEQGGRTLIDSGRLLASLATFADATRAIVGTNLVYAAIHQFGGVIRARGRAAGGAGALRLPFPDRRAGTPFTLRQSVTLPARPYLGFSAEDRVTVEALLSAHLDAAFGRSAP